MDIHFTWCKVPILCFSGQLFLNFSNTRKICSLGVVTYDLVPDVGTVFGFCKQPMEIMAA